MCIGHSVNIGHKKPMFLWPTSRLGCHSIMTTVLSYEGTDDLVTLHSIPGLLTLLFLQTSRRRTLQ